MTVDVVVLDKHGEPVAESRGRGFRRHGGRPPAAGAGLSTRDRRAGRRARIGRPRRAYRYSTNVGAQAHAGRSFVLFFDDVHLTQDQGERAKKALEQFLNDEAREPAISCRSWRPARALRWHARLPDGRAELVKVLASLRGSYLPDDQRGARQRLRGLSDPRHAGRADGRAGRAPLQQLPRRRPGSGQPPARRGPTAGEQRRDCRSARAVRADSRRGSLRARHGPQSRDPRRAQGDDRVDGAGARPEVGRRDVSRLHPRPGARAVQAGGGCRAAREHRDVLRRRPGTRSAIGVRLGAVRIADRFARRGRGERRLRGSRRKGPSSLAETSGGFSVQNRNDLAAGLRRIARESQVYYLLGYVPSNARADGKFRRISVRVDSSRRAGSRSKGLLRRRRSAGARPACRPRQTDALEVALESPYDLAALPVRAASYVFGATKAGDISVLLAMEADLRSFDLEVVHGRIASDVLDLRVLVTNPATGKTKRHERAVEMKLPGGVPDGRNVGLVSALGGLRAGSRKLPGAGGSARSEQRARRHRDARLRGPRQAGDDALIADRDRHDRESGRRSQGRRRRC